MVVNLFDSFKQKVAKKWKSITNEVSTMFPHSFSFLGCYFVISVLICFDFVTIKPMKRNLTWIVLRTAGKKDFKKYNAGNE